MDFSHQIRNKRDELKLLRKCEGVDSVLRHLDVAERHFESGKRSGDSDLFTDVIYRTNQAFEGILKEAYQTLAQKNLDKITPAKIEKYLTENNTFSTRVIEYFTRYRQDWRNLSVHDYRLDFDEQEAFLAISTVSAFCYVALDQMIRALAADVAKQRIVGVAQEGSGNVPDAEGLARFLALQLPGLFSDLSAEQFGSISEVSMHGAIEGVLRALAPPSQILMEPELRLDGNLLRPDFLLTSNKDSVVIEVKRVTKRGTKELARGPRLREQLSTYMRAAKAKEGVGVLLPSDPTMISEDMFCVTPLPDVDGQIWVVHPKVT